MKGVHEKFRPCQCEECTYAATYKYQLQQHVESAYIYIKGDLNAKNVPTLHQSLAILRDVKNLSMTRFGKQGISMQ